MDALKLLLQKDLIQSINEKTKPSNIKKNNDRKTNLKRDITEYIKSHRNSRLNNDINDIQFNKTVMVNEDSFQAKKKLHKDIQTEKVNEENIHVKKQPKVESNKTMIASKKYKSMILEEIKRLRNCKTICDDSEDMTIVLSGI